MTVILLISYASKGAFDESIVSIWFIIYAILQIPCIYYAIVFIIGARARDAYLKEQQENDD